MADKFHLEVELGNDAMKAPGDVAELLRRVAETLDGPTPSLTDRQGVRDLNGNTVGRWWFE